MYHTGGSDARSVRSKMQFMMTPVTPASDFDKHEAAFKDIQAYLMNLEAPKYPLPIDKELAAKGEKVFRANCSECHGTYGEKWTYPNRIVPLEKIGTDPSRFEGIPQKFGDVYNQVVVRERSSRGFVGRLSRHGDEGLSSPAARRHLGHGAVPPQRQRADALSHAQLEDAADSVYTSFHHGREGLRPR